jgi:hypothetical protein
LPLETRDFFATSETPAYRQLELLYRAAQLLGDWNGAVQHSLAQSGEGMNALREMLSRAVAIVQDLESWAQNLPGDWSYTNVPFNSTTIPSWLSPLLDAKWRPPSIRRFSTLQAHPRLTIFWTYCMTMTQAMLQSLEFLESQYYAFNLGRAVNRLELEFKLRDLIDSICGSAIATIDCPIPNKPAAKSIEEVCTFRGYYLMWTLPAVLLCLKQAPIKNFDVEGRIDWISKTLDFLGNNLGFAKAHAFTEYKPRNALSIQLWDYVG